MRKIYSRCFSGKKGESEVFRANSLHSCHAQRVYFSQPATYDQIVQHYIDTYQEEARKELKCSAIIKPLDEAIEKAGLALTPSGRKFSHQRRLPKVVLNQATEALMQQKNQIANCHSFRELMGIVKSSAGRVYGIGELYIYDTSLRLGARLNLYPEQVYLHAGTKKGARALGCDCRKDSIPVDILPPEFKVLTPHEIEDVLCIYKARLSEVRRGF